MRRLTALVSSGRESSRLALFTKMLAASAIISWRPPARLKEVYCGIFCAMRGEYITGRMRTSPLSTVTPGEWSACLARHLKAFVLVDAETAFSW